MTCAACEQIEDASDAGGPYIVKKCAACGRRMKIREPGKNGIGIMIREGDEVVIPQGWLKIAANPLKSTGHLSRDGLAWFAGLVFESHLNTRRTEFMTVISELEDEYGEILKRSPLLTDFDVEDPSQAEALYNKIKEDNRTAEWLVYHSAMYLSIVRDAIAAQDAQLAAWAMACAERLRSLYIFKEHFEEVVFMGHSAKRLTELLQLWDAHKTNGNEEFWQEQFQSHALALSQLFSVPVTLIEGKAYVGGQGIDRSDARFVDFLFSGGSASEAILIEIKTPVTQLMHKRAYRGNVYTPSAELTGSVVQVADYRNSLTRDLESLLRNSKHDLSAFNPKAIVIVGNSAELETDEKRRSFELFRSSLSNVEIVTFDEVFRKIEHLASLFNLVRTSPTSAS